MDFQYETENMQKQVGQLNLINIGTTFCPLLLTFAYRRPKYLAYKFVSHFRLQTGRSFGYLPILALSATSRLFG